MVHNLRYLNSFTPESSLAPQASTAQPPGPRSDVLLDVQDNLVLGTVQPEPHGALGLLLQRFAEYDLDQHDAWRLDTRHGSVFVRISREPGPGEPADALWPLARPATYATGRPADVDRLEQVASREDVLQVLAQMRSDLAGAGASGWENPTLERFLEAFSGFLGDIDGYFSSRGEQAPAQPSWSLLATLLVAATGYE